MVTNLCCGIPLLGLPGRTSLAVSGALIYTSPFQVLSWPTSRYNGPSGRGAISSTPVDPPSNAALGVPSWILSVPTSVGGLLTWDARSSAESPVGLLLPELAFRLHIGWRGGGLSGCCRGFEFQGSRKQVLSWIHRTWSYPPYSRVVRP